MTGNRIRYLFSLIIILLAGALSAEIVAPVVAVTAAVNSDPAATTGRNDRIVFNENSEWKVVDMSDVQVKAGSALDLSAISESGPAGKHGRLIISKNAKLAFEDSPDIARRFYGWNGMWITSKYFWKTVPNDLDKKILGQKIAAFAQLVKRQGYNIVRPLALEAYMSNTAKDCELDPVRIDNVDRLIAELKANGVYTYLTISAYRNGRADGSKAWNDRNDNKLKLYLGDPETRARWKTFAEKQLNHVNPYTGIAWKDDPAIAVVEFYNEQDICSSPAPIARLSQNTRDLAAAKWREWLLKKYKTVAALSSTWGDSGLNSPGVFAKLELPKDDKDTGPQMADFSLFFNDLARDEVKWCEAIVRDSGYKGIIAQFNFSKKLTDSVARWENTELSIINCYTGGSTLSGPFPGSKCYQGGTTEQAANYWRAGNATRHANRPLMVTETHHFFWNQYQHEEGLVFAPYSALQGFSGMFVHEDPVALEVCDLDHIYADWSARNPVARANDFLSACLFRRGDVKEASRRVELQIPNNYLNASGNSRKAANTEQDKIALMTGFTVAFPQIQGRKAGNVNVSPADIVILPDSGAETVDGEWATSVSESKNSSFSIKDFVVKLKSKGILPATNQSNPERGVFQSETGEITMRTGEKLIKIITPKTEGVSLLADKSESLGCLSVERSSVPAAIAAVAIDGNPLAQASHIVLIYNTAMAFTGMETSAIDSSMFNTMYNMGKMPILMRTGKLNITLKCKNPAKMALYALRIDGTRRDKLPVTADGDVLKITIDTAALKNGNTPFFELVAE